MAIKALGDDTEKLQHIKIGNKVTVDGPYGNILSNVVVEKKQLWIAGGIGVTPFLSYLRQKRKASSGGQDIFLLLFLKEEHDNVFINEMSNITGLTVVIHIDTRDGSPDLKNVLPEDWKDRNIIISGPSIMVREFKSELYSIGASKIQSEEFDF